VIRAYSYLRFSSEAQKQGHSTERQKELIQNYLNDHKELTLVESYEDLGLSGYHAKNKTEGNLGVFLALVNDGKIPKGSYLLVEALDRLSREIPADALASFLQITNAGITLVTLADQKTYSKESSKENPFELMGSLMLMIQAHEESDRKSFRVKQAWKGKRDRARSENKPYSKRCPGWLKLTNEGYEVIPNRVTTVKRVFELAKEGFGKEYIHRKLNEENLETFGNSKGWSRSSVARLLNNIAVYGSMQPKFTERVDGKVKSVNDGEPIENFYPVIITKQEFNHLQGLKRRTQTVGRKGKTFSNILGGLAVCNKCKSSMTFVNKGKDSKFLYCSSSKSKTGCTAKPIAYEPVEKAVITVIGYADISPIVVDANESHESELLVAEEELEQVKVKLQQFMADYEENPIPLRSDLVTKYAAKETELTEQLKALKEQPTVKKNMLADLKKLGDELTSEDENTKYKARASVKVLLTLYFSKLLITDEWKKDIRKLCLVSKTKETSYILKIERVKSNTFDDVKKIPIPSLAYSHVIYDQNKNCIYYGAGFLSDYTYIDPEDFADLSDFPEEDDTGEFDFIEVNKELTY
jgi:DNA invertase Pin-like site-specific DNA recombinase